MTQTPGRQRIVMLALLVCAALWSAVLIQPHLTGRPGVIDTLENRLVDIRYVLTGPKAATADVVIVAIDDETLANSTNGRQLLASLIANIAQSGARVLALDVLLVEQGGLETDKALADALASLPSHIAAAAVYGADAQTPANIIWPQPIFRNAAKAGLVNLSTDASGTPRYAPLLVSVDGAFHPSLALLTAMAFTGEQARFEEMQLALGDVTVPLDLGFDMPIRFSGPAGSVTTISANDLLSGPMRDVISGKAVVLGFTASAMGDRFSTPFDESTPGVEIIATVISQLTGSPTLRRDADVRRWDAVHATGLSLLCVFFIIVWPLSRGLPVALALISVSMVAMTVTFSGGIWMSAALPLAAAVPSVLVAGAMRYAQERQKANRSERTVATLRRFQAPALAEKIENDPEYLVAPIEQELVILFADVTGFTGIAQRLGPSGTRDLLQMFHTLSSDTVETRGGSVLSFMGDGIIAVFGLEAQVSGTPADSALLAAFDLAKALSEQSISELPGERLDCRIGLHSGLVTLSRLGAERHQQVTVTGDSVNLASRLMEVAKEEQAVIVASKMLCEAITNRVHTDNARQLEVPIRGRNGSVQVLIWTRDAITQGV